MLVCFRMPPYSYITRHWIHDGSGEVPYGLGGVDYRGKVGSIRSAWFAHDFIFPSDVSDTPQSLSRSPNYNFTTQALKRNGIPS